MTDERSRLAVEVAERFADGITTAEELSSALTLAWQAYHDIEEAWVAPLRREPPGQVDAGYQVIMKASEAIGYVAMDECPRLPHRDDLTRVELVFSVIVDVAEAASRAVGHQDSMSHATERAVQTALLRDVFGPLPFRPVTMASSVLARNDRLVVRLAQAIYDERSWADMPLLTDALLDAGCGSEEVVKHCWSGSGHVRGCWVLDCLLGRQ
jgi:hypothetical protein